MAKVVADRKAEESLEAVVDAASSLAAKVFASLPHIADAVAEVEAANGLLPSLDLAVGAAALIEDVVVVAVAGVDVAVLASAKAALVAVVQL